MDRPIRLSYSDIKQQFLRNAGKAGSSQTNLLADFNSNLGQRYQLILARMADYVTQQDQTTSTIDGQQYYHYPPGIVSIDSVTVTIGSVQYPMTPMYNQYSWDLLNALQIQPTAIPQFFFARRDDFGIWPIPQSDDYTISFKAFMRFINLSIDDYTDGTIAISQGSTQLVGTATTFTPAMIGRWFTMNDNTYQGYGYWYRIVGWVSATELTLETYYTGETVSGVVYRVGQTPEIPEEGHILLADGPTADFYFGLKDDAATAQAWENKFWTGDRTNTNRTIGDHSKIAGGLIGLMNRYQSRDKKRLIYKQPQPYLPAYQVWSTTLS